MTLERLRSRSEGFLERAGREWYEVVRDPARRSAYGARYAEAADLFSLARISEAQRAVSESAGLEERRARFLLAFLVRGRARCAAAVELDRRLDFETLGAVELGERRIAPSAIPARLARTEDPGERRALEEAWLDALAVEEPVFHDLLQREREVYEELGYGSLLESCEILSETDLHALAREGARTLEESEGELRELLDWFLPRVAGVAPREATAGDRFALWWAAPTAPLFGEPAALRNSIHLLANAGLAPLAGGRIRLERRGEVRRTAGALACPLRIPQSIALVYSGGAGLSTHHAELSALGRAMHAGYTDPDLALEFRWMGDEAVPLAWGALLGGLLFDASFVRDRYGAGSARLAEHRRISALLLLLRLRRRVALLRVAMAWCAARGLPEVAEEYPTLLETATGLRHDPRQAAWDVGLPSEAAAYLRAEQLGAILREHLRERFDEDWYRNPRAGEALVHLLRDGRRFTAAELAVQLTSRPLSSSDALARVRELLR
jgi:hypothetical protein